MKFGELIKRENTELIISRRYDEWMERNANPVYSDVALAFLHSQITTPTRVRAGTVSSSSVGSCARRQCFTFLGMPELPPSPKLAAIFQNGQFMHLRWQMAGLTEGFITQVEVAVPDNEYRLAGTIDAVAMDDSLIELKSINSNGYRSVQTFGAKTPHMMQLATYLACTEREEGRFIYENKDTQEYVEIPFNLDDEWREEISLRADYVWGLIDHHKLPDPLDKCMAREGQEYNSCPYRDRCLGIQTWDQATLT